MTRRLTNRQIDEIVNGPARPKLTIHQSRALAAIRDAGGTVKLDSDLRGYVICYGGNGRVLQYQTPDAPHAYRPVLPAQLRQLEDKGELYRDHGDSDVYRVAKS